MDKYAERPTFHRSHPKSAYPLPKKEKGELKESSPKKKDGLTPFQILMQNRRENFKRMRKTVQLENNDEILLRTFSLSKKIQNSLNSASITAQNFYKEREKNEREVFEKSFHPKDISSLIPINPYKKLNKSSINNPIIKTPIFKTPTSSKPSSPRKSDVPLNPKLNLLRQSLSGNIINNSANPRLTTIRDNSSSSHSSSTSSSPSSSFSLPPPPSSSLLLPSPFLNRPSTIFFPYPPFLSLPPPSPTSPSPSSYNPPPSSPLILKIPKRISCIISAFNAAGFSIETEGSDWNAFWGVLPTSQLRFLHKHQKVNHFPGCWQIGRKDNLFRNINKLKNKFEGEFDFLPKTYLLSSEFERFEKIRKEAPSKSLWIIKPVNSSRGRGIRVISKKCRIKPNKDYLASEYILNPHLLNGLKYDLRLYVLVSSFDPLRVYLYEEGLTRFATEKFSTKKSKIKKKFIHLTNYSINKKANQFMENNQDNEAKGSKWALSTYKREMEALGVNVGALFERIKDIIVKSCISVEPYMLDSFNKMSEHKNNCYELYGFDILIDSNFKPWVMEVNVSPSLNSSSPLDKKIKTMLICDTMNLVGYQPFDKKKLESTSLFKNPIQNSLTLKNNFEDKKGSIRTINDIEDLTAENCIEKLSSDQWNILFENEEEFYRKGRFERIFPNEEKTDFYSKFFQYPRINNLIWWRLMRSKDDYLAKVLSRIPAPKNT